MAHVKVVLVKDLARHLRAGHPWVYRQALSAVPKVPAGSIVDVVEHGRFVARGYFDPKAAICIRILTRDPTEAVDGALFRLRVGAALALRRESLDLSATDAFRLIHGEADGLPGVVVDLYAGFAVLRLYSEGLVPHRDALLSALRAEVEGLQGVVARDEPDLADPTGQERGVRARTVWGEEPPPLIPIRENGVRFLVDPRGGQKTGFFLDQRDNRRLVRTLGKGREVLNCYAFSGGFSVNAALGGATRVVSVDIDEDAIALARRHFSENGLEAAAHDFLAADVPDTLKAFANQGRSFDLVILDPPAFAKTQKAVEAAVDGYASLNRQALALLRPGGLLCTASCTARVSDDEFLGAVKEAAFKTGVDLVLLHQNHHAPDHPVLLQFPEGRYLKFLALKRVGGAAVKA